jgi:cytochrome b561
MQLANSAERYGVISRALHWLTALFVVVAWILGIMNDAFPKGDLSTAALFFPYICGTNDRRPCDNAHALALP